MCLRLLLLVHIYGAPSCDAPSPRSLLFCVWWFCLSKIIIVSFINVIRVVCYLFVIVLQLMYVFLSFVCHGNRMRAYLRARAHACVCVCRANFVTSRARRRRRFLPSLV